MATEIRPVVLSDEERRLIDESFHHALESINKIHGPLQLADRAKASRLAKISYDLAQLHKEAHMDDTISSSAPTRSDLGLLEKSSPTGISVSRAVLQGSGKEAVITHSSHDSENHSQEQQAEEKQIEKPTWAKIAASREVPKKGHDFSNSEIAAIEQRTKMKVEPGRNHKLSNSEIDTIEQRTKKKLYISALWEQKWKEGDEEERRVVEMYQLPKSYTLRDLTRNIHEGPLIQIKMINDQGSDTKWAVIVFMKAEDARSFYLTNEAIRARMGGNQSCYGPGINAVWGNPYPVPEVVSLMEGKGGARRRLTFSGRQLFAKIRPTRFYTDIATIAGKKNIELAWLFNRGNATVVFSRIGTACAIREYFTAKASEPGPYQGITVTFSADPCEAHISLVTQMPGGGAVEV